MTVSSICHCFSFSYLLTYTGILLSSDWGDEPGTSEPQAIQQSLCIAIRLPTSAMSLLFYLFLNFYLFNLIG